MDIIQDIDRPDVNGVPAKMKAIAQDLHRATAGRTPFLAISCNDNIMSSVWLKASLQPREEWSYGIYENSPHFAFSLTPEKGKRYYTDGEPITVELARASYKIRDRVKFRKYTGSAEKCIKKILDYIAAQKD